MNASDSLHNNIIEWSVVAANMQHVVGASKIKAT